ncbi:hypothetical protein BCR41DRAFT_233829 [Lobosporangium transversale]|uniref:Smr domain-containing protein n=1 Tax=Lobosporangium transversale TaxID=64571 RepID=A0A1Y2GUQ0_9FUNG|nr:hypothetical protein BCR41DRAFT_233829 [Lobosporangium transversale]ORZ24802.1 hypothetical protein BCR41DRAFT_233829 [Lobosporangium transversale]|eukprot:XP_021883783.1 hypothetical protein BCR41DRAFT_233829 [Lobosporangium transversale]
MDLHGLRVDEAEYYTQERMIGFIEDKEKKLKIIVGRGKHSLGGIPKIKPAVMELLKEFEVEASFDPSNDGCIFVRSLQQPCSCVWNNRALLCLVLDY